MKPVVIFGMGVVAEVIYYYMVEECGFEVVGCTVDRDYVSATRLDDLDVVPFEDVTDRYPPDQYLMFVALGYQDLSAVRAERVAAAKQRGYQLTSVIHPRASIPKGTPIGENCFIMNNVLIQPKASIGDNVFAWSGAVIGHHSSVGNNCWITSGACICGSVVVEENCFLGANATIGNDITVGRRSFLGAASLVTKDLDASSVVIAESSEKLRLNSDQFLRLSKFR